MTMTSGTSKVSDQTLLDCYKSMIFIREFELAVGRGYRDGDIPGFVHLSIGQESSAVGVVEMNLKPEDRIFTSHRGHGHCLARGLDPDRMMAELFGRSTGTCRGKAGSMHVADPSLGMLGANGIVGAGLPMAVGAGLACRARQQGIAAVFFGEGATATGLFHESLHLAKLWSLPVLFVCENNGLVEFSRWQDISTFDTTTRVAAALGLATAQADGASVESVIDAARSLTGAARAGEGPSLLEIHTQRHRGHYEGDAQKYRDDSEMAGLDERDPVVACRKELLANRGATETDVQAIDDGARERVAACVEYARHSEFPAAEEVLAHV